jgi:hypothetical protein
MRALRVVIVCAALAALTLALPAGAHAQALSCGNWEGVPNGRVTLDVGDPFKYNLRWPPEADPQARLDYYEVFFGDGTSASNTRPLLPGPGTELPEGDPKSYSAPGTYALSLSTRGQLDPFTPCANDRYPLGLIDVLSPCGTLAPCPPAPVPPPAPTPRPCSTCVSTPRAATTRCRRALGRFLARRYPRATGRVVTCRRARSGKFPCVVKWRDRKCKCRYRAKATVSARGSVRIFSVRRDR